MNRRELFKGLFASGVMASVPLPLSWAVETGVPATPALTQVSADELNALIRHYMLPRIMENLYRPNVILRLLEQERVRG